MTPAHTQGLSVAMLTVLIDVRPTAQGLPGLLAQLAAGALQGMVRQVLVVGDAGDALIGAICEESGADPHPMLASGLLAARAERLLILPAGLRLPDDWIGRLEAHMASGGGSGRLRSAGDGWLRRSRAGLLVERRLVEDAVDDAELERRLRRIGLRAPRIG